MSPAPTSTTFQSIWGEIKMDYGFCPLLVMGELRASFPFSCQESAVISAAQNVRTAGLKHQQWQQGAREVSALYTLWGLLVWSSLLCKVLIEDHAHC